MPETSPPSEFRYIPIRLRISRTVGFVEPFCVSDAVFEAGYGDAVVGTGIPSLAIVEADIWGVSEDEVRTQAVDKISAKLPKDYQILI